MKPVFLTPPLSPAKNITAIARHRARATRAAAVHEFEDMAEARLENHTDRKNSGTASMLSWIIELANSRLKRASE